MPLQTIDRTLDVLAAFGAKQEFGVSEMARAVGLPKSATHRILSTLTQRGFLEQGENHRYRLGLKVLELGNACRLRMELATVAQPILQSLSVQANCNSHLAKLDGLEVVDVLRAEYPAPFRIGRTAMLRRPAHCTALGKALLAFSDGPVAAEVISAGLPRLTPYTITRPERFLSELARIRQRGYAVDNEEFYAGRRCLAAPVFDEHRRAVAAISISAMITEITEDRVPAYGAMVVESASEISTQLGYRGAPVRNAGFR
ncbi:MAG: IclR family transcriptional regulator [Bryobacteraceae bacterium]|nr:IclR family transcriptional regulator [Bryobacteraceae bacterium]